MLILEQSVKFVGLPVKFEKRDTYGQYIVGAKLQLKDEKGTIVDTWTSEAKAKEFVLADSDYTLTEIEAPANFGTSSPTKFTVRLGKMYIGGREVEDVTVVCEDAPLTALPDACRMGTMPFAAAGILMMLGLPVYSIVRKRR